MADRTKIINAIKTAGSLMMYIGSAGLMSQFANKAQENHNAVTNGCIFASSAVLSLGMGKLASGWFEKAVDDVTEFIDDVKSPAKKEDEANG